MPDPATICLIRHAEPAYGPEGPVCLGRKLDVPLSPEGRRQAALLAGRVQGIKFDAIYTSPLKRAMQTAEALDGHCPRIVAPELTEVSGGEWDGMRFSEIHARYPSWFDNSEDGGRTPPGGESDAEALGRGMALMDRLKDHSGETFALVTHSGLGRILLCHLMGMPMHLKRLIPMDYASVTRVEYAGGAWRVALSEPLMDDIH